jgi:hypothetical protein
MFLRRIILGAVGVLLVVVIGGLVWTWHLAIPPISAPSGTAVDERVFRLGAELAAIGNCNDCHVANSGTPYAGGRSIPTPFGTIFSSNISPDAATGIATWSEAAFRRFEAKVSRSFLQRGRRLLMWWTAPAPGIEVP